jgi:enamine deaminase RidA (YjgF/YER057c/UK114 family)
VSVHHDEFGTRALAELPEPPPPAASYLSVRRKDDLLFVAGQLPFVNGILPVTGKLGEDLETEEGQQQARQAMLNALAAAAHFVGNVHSLRAVQVTVFVASSPNYLDHHLVANGASETLIEMLGERGEHARTTAPTPCLAMNAPVEVKALFQIVAGPSPRSEDR